MNPTPPSPKCIACGQQRMIVVYRYETVAGQKLGWICLYSTADAQRRLQACGTTLTTDA